MVELLEWVDYQAAEELRIKVRALCWHAFAVAGDSADVFHCGGHHEGGEFESAAGAGLAGCVASGGVAFLQAADDFFDIADVFRSRERGAGSEERVDDQTVQDADA